MDLILIILIILVILAVSGGLFVSNWIFIIALVLFLFLLFNVMRG
jgi:hypothetical protein